MKIGNDVDHAVEFNMALGPAAEVIRLAAADAEKVRPRLKAEIREVLAQFARGSDGVTAQSSTWIIAARARAEA